MLAKLMKYELKATGRVFLPLYIALAVLAVINRFMVTGSTSWGTPMVISITIYAVFLVSMFIIALVITIQRFSKNLLSEEGHLMFTLPVKPWQHIVSKMLVAMFWIVISTAIAYISVLIITFRVEDSAIINRDDGAYAELAALLGASPFVYFVEIAIGTLVTLAATILLIYASLAIGHLFSRHRILASFAAFVVLHTLTKILTALVVLVVRGFYQEFSIANYYTFLLNFLGNPYTLLFVNYWEIRASFLLNAVFGAIFFAISHRILSRHLNLD